MGEDRFDVRARLPGQVAGGAGQAEEPLDLAAERSSIPAPSLRLASKGPQRCSSVTLCWPGCQGRSVFNHRDCGGFPRAKK
jgi:hypothetical protein